MLGVPATSVGAVKSSNYLAMKRSKHIAKKIFKRDNNVKGFKWSVSCAITLNLVPAFPFALQSSAPN